MRAKAHNVNAVLMTYHINPTYLSAGEFESLAAEERIPLVRNDVPFDELIEKGTSSRYLLHDRWHPNRFGYAMIAKNAFEEITRGDLLSMGTGKGQIRMPVDMQQAEQFPAYPEQRGIVFATSGIQSFLGIGWSGPEGPYRWTDNLRAEILFALNDPRASTIEFRMQPFVFPGRLHTQRVLITLNGKNVASLSLSDSSPKELAVPLPEGVLEKTNILRFEVPDAQSPQSLGISEDSRRLGVAVESIRLRP